MKGETFKLILLLALIFMETDVFSQKEKPILELNKTKRYELYFIDVAVTGDEHEVQNTTQLNSKIKFQYDSGNNFLVDDQKTIWDLRNQWTGEPSNGMYLCWYHYFIYLVEDGKIIDELRVNTECKQVVSSRGIFNFKIPPFDKLDTSKVITVADVEFNSIEHGRNFIKALEPSHDVFIPELSEATWNLFDGEFTIEARKKKGDKVEKELAQYFKEHNPGDRFEIRESGQTGTTISYTIACNKQLADTFSLYSIEFSWEPLEVRPIRIFSKTTASITELDTKYAR